MKDEGGRMKEESEKRDLTQPSSFILHPFRRPRWWAEHGELALDEEGILWIKGPHPGESDLGAQRLGPIDADWTLPVPIEHLDSFAFLLAEWRDALSTEDLHAEWGAEYYASRGV